jgi:rod shape-determining protein MreC
MNDETLEIEASALEASGDTCFEGDASVSPHTPVAYDEAEVPDIASDETYAPSVEQSDGADSPIDTGAELRAEIVKLRAELEGYKNLVYDAELIGEENKFLNSFLGIKEEHVDFLFEDATVIGRESTNYRTVYTLSKGTLHGIEVNMPIITEEGLVGHITEVGATWSKAVLLTETASAVGGFVERSGVLGVVEGTYELRTEGVCRMVYIEPDSDIRVGDKVVSSGIGGVYPRGLMIGKITRIEMDEASRTLTATIEPAADLDSVAKLMIITEYNIYSERED